MSRATFTGLGFGISQRLGTNGADFSSTGTPSATQESFSSRAPGWLRVLTSGGTAISYGDSGGPTLRDGTNVAAGIVSWSGAW